MKPLLFLVFLGFVWYMAPAATKDPTDPSNGNGRHPEQIHLSFGEKINDIVVTWSTMLDTKESVVQFGEKTTNHKATGQSTLFVDGGSKKRKQWIHRVTLKDLKHDTAYVYKVGSTYGMSKEFSFKTAPAGEDFVVNAIFFGDMGVYYGKEHHTVEGLKHEIQNAEYHMVVHNGDIAYNMDSDDGKRGDDFMNMLEPVAARVPYMTSPGNHEAKYNFSHYKNRFSMPGGSENMFYSFNLGLVHFIVTNLEVYFGESKAEVQTHYNWLVNDLKDATKEENRKKRPWIILFGHRVMYCSSTTGWDQCRDGNKDHDYPQRVGIPKFGGMGLEVLLKDYGVDMVIWAHEHYYERSWPLYNKTVYNGTHGAYINPGAPVHITSGAAGNDESQDNFYKDPHAWSAFRSRDYGYGRLRVFNRTHLYWDEMSTDNVKLVPGRGLAPPPTKIDKIWLVRDEHKPYDIK